MSVMKYSLDAGDPYVSDYLHSPPPGMESAMRARGSSLYRDLPETNKDISIAGEPWRPIDPDIEPSRIGEDSTDIAPWWNRDEPPTPPPKPDQKRSFGFAQKRSIPTFSINRHPYHSNGSVRSRGSESTSFAESFSSSHLESAPDLRKPKSSLNLMHIIKRKASRIGKDDPHGSVPTPPPPPLPSPTPSASFLEFSPTPPVQKKVRRKRENVNIPLPPPVPDLALDLGVDKKNGIVGIDPTKMYGIVDMNVATQDASRRDTSSPASGFESNYHSSSLSTSESSALQAISASPPRFRRPSSPTMKFSDPFLPTANLGRRKGVPPQLDFHKISPKTIVPPPPTEGTQYRPGWEAPESWAVERTGDVPDVPEYTSSDEDGPTPLKQQKRRTRHPKRPQSLTTYHMRIHRLDGTYHVVKCPLNKSVADLIPALNRRLTPDPTREAREPHSLYVKERERERVLALTERPADLVRRRLEQAGYDVADGLQTLGSDEIGFLIQFIYKSNALGGAGAEDVTVDQSEFIDLTGRSLKTIPIVLYSRADALIYLNLSRNPMLEIPLDFIQSCTTLRELRLSNMAMKKVPQSVRHCQSLHRLDISCNRIADLDDAGLDRIPQLRHLLAQNNRMDKLPWYFPRLHSLKFLNISNNKFQHLPDVVPQMTNLVDLDISFNNISSLPEDIGQLHSLERLLIVGNQISKIPEECVGLVNLATFDCRRNNISDLSLVCKLPKMETLLANHNSVYALDLAVGCNMEQLDASYNDITKLTVAFGPMGPSPYRLTSLNISHAKLSSLDNIALKHLTTLTELRLDHNSFRCIPDELGALHALTFLSCSDNKLDALPESIGQLQNLQTLDVHNNSLTELPASMWQCASLQTINVTSNAMQTWHNPPTPPIPFDQGSMASELTLVNYDYPERKASVTPSLLSSFGGRPLPPLARSLRKLYLGENRLTSDALHPLTALRGLRILNLSFNKIQELPSSFFRNLTSLEELYLSGNKLSSIPTEDLPRLTKLTVLFLNGNKFMVLPQELGKILSLTVLDVGSNLLKYNINNWEFDWNWNFNINLKYLNLSGNKRLKISPDSQVSQRMSIAHNQPQQRKPLADFANLGQLRVLGLMDVTTTDASSIPEDSEDRRVRTSLSEVNQMAYGIADTLGTTDHLSMLDLVAPEFRERRDECVFAMFGRAHAVLPNNRVSKYLAENFLKTFSTALDRLDRSANEGVPDALRRAFLTLNKTMHADFTKSANLSRKMSQASASTTTMHTQQTLQSDSSVFRSGASGIVAYFSGRTMYVANAGDALAVISRLGSAHLVSKKHEPFDRSETARIRAAEGWVSPTGEVNEESDVSRSFGFYHLLPAVNPRPDICIWEISESDEFVIIANRGLWDFVSYQVAVDIARREKDEPMIAAQKLRDFAISYGADGSTMIMVISVATLCEEKFPRSTAGSLGGVDEYIKPPPQTLEINDPMIARLPDEVPAPTGQVALVFTDIRNSTHLWEVNPGMPTAMRLHNALLRRWLRLCGGYEVKTEGDAFMCSFSTVPSALQWCLTVQIQLLHESWPLEILECEDGKEILDSKGKLIARGLSVRMGLHWGTPVSERDPITNRMDYFGPMVNRSARICGSAAGGQLMCSADAIREIKTRVIDRSPGLNFDQDQPTTIDTIRELGVEIVHVGGTKMKGLEALEVISLVYPRDLLGRQELKESAAEADASGSKVQFSVEQMRHLALLCVRLEVLASSRVFRPIPQRKNSVPPVSEDPEADNPVIMLADPNILIPSIMDKASDRELMILLDSLSLRIENALTSLTVHRMGTIGQDLMASIQEGTQPDQDSLMQLLQLLKDALPSHCP